MTGGFSAENRQSLAKRVDCFLRISGIAPSRLGRLSAGDPGLVADMRRGRRVGQALARRIEAFMEGWSASRAGGTPSSGHRA